MRNVTVTLDEETERWARLEAARRDISVASLIRELLKERMGEQVAYERGKTRFLARPAGRLSGGRRYPARDELYE